MNSSLGSPSLVLASASPRRRELLEQIGVRYVVDAAGVVEERLPAETPKAYVERLARAKAAAVWQRRGGDAPVLGADTTVTLGDTIFGKPADRADGLRMLQALSGREHVVLTAVALASSDGLAVRVSESYVRFRTLTAAECAAYWESGEPLGKAGGYAVQGRGAVFIAELRGSYSGVMGLPLFETGELLRLAHVPIWQAAPERNRA